MLLLICICSVVTSCFEQKFTLNFPRVLIHVVNVQVLVRIVPSNYKQAAIIAKDVVAERAHFRKLGVSFHQILFHVKSEALIGPNGFVKSSENKNSFVVYGHAHCQITGSPCAL